jgi:hypothetical protein
MAWHESVSRNYTILTETLNQGTAVAVDAVQQAGKVAKAAASVAAKPQVLVSGGVRTVGKLGVQTLNGLDQSRLQMKKAAEEYEDEDSGQPPVSFPQSSRYLRLRNKVNPVLLFFCFPAQ